MGIPIKNAMNKMIRTVRGDIKIIAMDRAPMFGLASKFVLLFI